MKISVLLSARDAEATLPEALAGFEGEGDDVEFVLVDDGSTDGTGDLLERFLEGRPGRLLAHDEPHGLTRSLNEGLAACRGRFVARMDADDVSLPGRLDAQATFLESHPDVVVVGTAATRFDAGPGNWERPAWVPVDDATIRARLALVNPLLHPSVLMRRDAAVDARYDESLETSQDYELWTRLAERGRLANLPEAWLRLRAHPGQVSRRRGTIQATNSACISRAWMERAGLGPLDRSEHGALATFLLRAAPQARDERRVAVDALVAVVERSVADAPAAVAAAVAANESVHAARFLNRLRGDPSLSSRLAVGLSRLHPGGRAAWLRAVGGLASARGRRRIEQGPGSNAST